jgi:hypothetical protein
MMKTSPDRAGAGGKPSHCIETRGKMLAIFTWTSRICGGSFRTPMRGAKGITDAEFMV